MPGDFLENHFIFLFEFSVESQSQQNVKLKIKLARTHTHIWTHFNRANEQIQLNGLANELVLNKLV